MGFVKNLGRITKIKQELDKDEPDASRIKNLMRKVRKSVGDAEVLDKLTTLA